MAEFPEEYYIQLTNRNVQIVIKKSVTSLKFQSR